MSNPPVILIPSNHVKGSDGMLGYSVKDQYVRPIVEILKGIPLLIPAIGKDFSLKSIAHKIDGILLTGAPSHVNPSCYGGEREFGEEDLDTDRDETDLPLIRDAIDLDIPLFAICRGFQELNVTCGGTLHQYVHKQPNMMDHRPPKGETGARRYEIHQHKIHSQKGGMFERMGLPAEFPVNSLHNQGVNKLGAGLHVEGLSDDGLIEAVSMPGKRFIFGTQYHPEGDFWFNPTSKIIFEEFARAVHK
jgi:putative glutamine amidotransferase